VRVSTVSLICLGAAAVLALGCGPFHSLTIGKAPSYEPPHQHGGHGPPPHAPAHGRRAKHGQGHHHGDGAAEAGLVFDAALGVYVVVDVPDHYFWDGVYLRVENGRWYSSVDLDGGHWEPRSEAKLPPGLAKRHKDNWGKAGHKHKGPAKRNR